MKLGASREAPMDGAFPALFTQNCSADNETLTDPLLQQGAEGLASSDIGDEQT
jgi:hypothetical protein